MHERALVAETIATIEELVVGRTVRSVEIALGPGVDVGAATEAWEELVSGTPLEHAHVIWEGAVDLFRCDSCGAEYRGGMWDVCPYCGADGTVIESAPPISLGRWQLEAPGGRVVGV